MLVAADFEIGKGFQGVLQGMVIFPVARFIPCRQDDIGDRAGQLDIRNPFPLGVSLRRGVFVNKIRVAVA